MKVYYKSINPAAFLQIPTPYGHHLPIFPTFYNGVTEEKVERAVERMMDRADSAFTAGKATQAQYDAWVSRLNEWANNLL